MLKSQKGLITTLTVVFGGIFLIVLTSLLLLIGRQHRFSLQKVAYEQALNTAEAGLEYYAWHLLHFPGDLQDGTGGPGPYEHGWQDSSNNVESTFSLDITGTTQCGDTTSVTVTSTGWRNDFSNLERTVRAKFFK